MKYNINKELKVLVADSGLTTTTTSESIQTTTATNQNIDNQTKTLPQINTRYNTNTDEYES